MTWILVHIYTNGLYQTKFYFTIHEVYNRFHYLYFFYNNTKMLASHFFFFNDPATTKISPLPLHAPLPISDPGQERPGRPVGPDSGGSGPARGSDGLRARLPHRRRRLEGQHLLLPGRQERVARQQTRSEEHTSELQSQSNLVCRLLLEKKKQ